jgi:hypothetical protein
VKTETAVFISGLWTTLYVSRHERWWGGGLPRSICVYKNNLVSTKSTRVVPLNATATLSLGHTSAKLPFLSRAVTSWKMSMQCAQLKNGMSCQPTLLTSLVLKT